VVDLKTCAIKNNFIDRTKVCSNEIRNGSCQKDSGGALYFASGRQYFIGIISYGTFCASKIPSVNTRVTSHVGWIEENTRGFFCRKT
jgi:secreted trypsin-like serine protease